MIFPLLDTAQRLAWHGGASHSLIIVGLGSYIFARGLVKFWPKAKINGSRFGWFLFIVWCSHVLLDCLTVVGADFFWPISNKRISFNLLHPIDFLFSAPLVIAALWLLNLKEPVLKKTRIKKPTKRSKRLICSWLGIGLSVVYLLFSCSMKYVASTGFGTDLAQRGKKYECRIEVPTPYNCLLWRGVVDRGDEFWVGYRTVFEQFASPVRWTIYPKNEFSLSDTGAIRETKTLTGFTNGWWIARSNSKGAWVGDIRAPESRVWGSKKGMVDSRLELSWAINPSLKSDRLRYIFPDEKNSSDYLQRLVQRIFGNSEVWEANPRLAGIPGSLPEFLPVHE